MENQSRDTACALPPPPYSSHPGDTRAGDSAVDSHDTHDQSSPPAYTPRPERQSQTPSHGNRPAAARQRPPRQSNPHPPPAPSESQTASQSISKSPMSFLKGALESYEEKRRAKESLRKVDYYERMYGFVPKNVMTEAEWRGARERAPKTKAKTQFGAKGYFGGGGFGGC